MHVQLHMWACLCRRVDVQCAVLLTSNRHSHCAIHVGMFVYVCLCALLAGNIKCCALCLCPVYSTVNRKWTGPLCHTLGVCVISFCVWPDPVYFLQLVTADAHLYMGMYLTSHTNVMEKAIKEDRKRGTRTNDQSLSRTRNVSHRVTTDLVLRA